MNQRLKSIESCLVITVGMLVLFLWLKNPWFLRIALVVGALGAFSPWAAQKIHQGWTFLAHFLGRINGTILLSAVFFLFLTPIAWLARRAKAMDLQLIKKPDGASYYAERNHSYESKDLENTW
jgi:hypothetical protein